MNSATFSITPIDLNENHIADFNSIWGIIYLEFDAVCFPDNEWYDAISSILSMWLTEILDLLKMNRQSGTLYFMDGPYRVNITYLNHNTLECRCIYADQESLVTTVPFDLFAKNLTKSTASFILKCQNNLNSPAICQALKQIISLNDELIKTTRGRFA